MVRAGEILQQAESGLRALVADAASDGDYEGVVQIAAWARLIGDFRKKTVTVRAAPIDSAQPERAESRRPGRASASTTSRRRATDDHLRFFRRGDQLIRVARSKRKKKEYQHKAPLSALKALVATFVEAGKDGRVFTTDQVLPIRDPAESNDIPKYQAYVCIAWLKQKELIAQHGRQGYSVPAPDRLSESVEAAWSELPRK